MREAIEKVNHWLTARVHGAVLDADGVTALARDDGTLVVLELEPNADICHLSAVVCPLPEDAHEEALYAALQMNRFGRALGGSWLSWDDTLQVFLLCHNISIAHIDAVGFNNTLDNFLSAVDEARRILMPELNVELPSPLVAA